MDLALRETRAGDNAWKDRVLEAFRGLVEFLRVEVPQLDSATKRVERKEHQAEARKGR